ncbi:hypothetical protein [Paenibacillus glacialis]|uniref:hypothetical protein n=1 Tax=Paenibacillus glacialis TaxID=494026 RepID=UPI00137230FD|nr:hypothetical protein [Paenibacillus glacialis]
MNIVLNHDGSVPYIIDLSGEAITGIIEEPGKLTWSIQLLSLIEKEVQLEKLFLQLNWHMTL